MYAFVVPLIVGCAPGVRSRGVDVFSSLVEYRWWRM